MNSSVYLADLHKVGLGDIEQVGGKNASLGEMLQNLVQLGIQIPGGFVITVAAYREFIRYNNLDEAIHRIINNIVPGDIESLRRGGLQARQLLKNAKFPKELSEAIIEKYYQLSKLYDQDITDVAVRSSATAEDLPDASFAGQQETYLNISGVDNVLEAIRHVFASLYNDRAISYRAHQGFEHGAVALSAAVQQMVRSDLGAAGVMFTLDTESGFATSCSSPRPTAWARWWCKGRSIPTSSMSTSR